MNFQTLRGAALALFAGPGAWLVVWSLLCLVLRENYPFSNFPMYSSFSRKRTSFISAIRRARRSRPDVWPLEFRAEKDLRPRASRGT